MGNETADSQKEAPAVENYPHRRARLPYLFIQRESAEVIQLSIFFRLYDGDGVDVAPSIYEF